MSQCCLTKSDNHNKKKKIDLKIFKQLPNECAKTMTIVYAKGRQFMTWRRFMRPPFLSEALRNQDFISFSHSASEAEDVSLFLLTLSGE